MTQTLLALRGLAQHLGWQQAASFLVQLTFTLPHFFEEVTPPQARLPSPDVSE